MAALPLTRNALHKSEMEYHGNFGHTIERIQHICLISRIAICYTTCNISTQTVAPTLPGFQGIKCCVQYLDSHPHKPIFILIVIRISQISPDLSRVGIKLKTKKHRLFHNATKMWVMLEFSTEDN